MYGYEPIVKSLIQAKAIFPKDLLHTAVVAERLSIVRLLIQMGVDLEARDQVYPYIPSDCLCCEANVFLYVNMFVQ